MKTNIFEDGLKNAHLVHKIGAQRGALTHLCFVFTYCMTLAPSGHGVFSCYAATNSQFQLNELFTKLVINQHLFETQRHKPLIFMQQLFS